MVSVVLFPLLPVTPHLPQREDDEDVLVEWVGVSGRGHDSVTQTTISIDKCTCFLSVGVESS